jgi:hypothetical protein
MRSFNPWRTFPTHLDPPVARSLTIQFILQELIAAFQIVEGFEQSAFTTFYKELEKLLIFSIDNPFSQKSSALDKLCFYFEILLQNSRIGECEIPLILEKMRNSAVGMRSKLIVWQKIPASAAQMREQYESFCLSMREQLQAFFEAMRPFLKNARTDENVLVFLLEKRESLNRFLGERCVENLLCSFFPAGFEQLRAVIIEGYSRRGFTAFLESIEPLIERVEWESPCCPAKIR